MCLPLLLYCSCSVVDVLVFVRACVMCVFLVFVPIVECVSALLLYCSCFNGTLLLFVLVCVLCVEYFVKCV